jgi:SAM-dependent methyltransferase
MVQINRLEYFRNRYSQLKPGWTHATARYQELITRHIKPQYRILDLGCGRGGVVERLGGSGKWLGIDPDWHSLKYHRSTYFLRSCGDAYALPLPRHSFDIVVSSWVMEHLAEPGRAFKEIARVLRPGGHFFFLTPNSRHPILWFSRILANNLARQRVWTQRLYKRLPMDTFPVQYKANTWQSIDTLAVHAGLQLVELELIEDPSYLAWNTVTFILAVMAESLLPVLYGIHIVGHYVFQP